MTALNKAPGLDFDSLQLVDRPWFPYLCTEIDFWQWKTAGEDHFNFWLALAGDGYLSCDGQAFRIQPGSFFVFSPHQSISAAHYSGPRITRFSAHFFPLRNGERLQQIEGLPHLGGVVDSLASAKRQIDLIMRVALRREDDAVLARKLYEFILQVTGGRTCDALSPAVSEALRVFREDPASVQSIHEFARSMGISRSHFDREFTAQIGQPPRQFLINCKIIEARRYLESSSLRVGEIAEALGYKDIYFFSRQFKQLVGLSPVHYRRGLQV
ncbi:helix-turn-helix domain-containing protein [Coraliomargarita sinensis]|uniref:helix-turn-helix domain-containing protein n=1 Tax=Coraliomargarita sinensis TaxID=2174842 RepID=UPI001304C2E3|nr:AraC family transcriptional regulator [Coraliomargarita sinensis]